MSERMYLPAPSVHEAEDQCKSCQGGGVTGQQFTMAGAENGRVLVLDAICPDCDGCGRNDRHIGCEALQHAGWKPRGDAADPPVDGCASCDGRRWFVVTAWGDAGEAATLLRAPCQCAEPLLVTL